MRDPVGRRDLFGLVVNVDLIDIREVDLGQDFWPPVRTGGCSRERPLQSARPLGHPLIRLVQRLVENSLSVDGK